MQLHLFYFLRGKMDHRSPVHPNAPGLLETRWGVWEACPQANSISQGYISIEIWQFTMTSGYFALQAEKDHFFIPYVCSIKKFRGWALSPILR